MSTPTTNDVASGPPPAGTGSTKAVKRRDASGTFNWFVSFLSQFVIILIVGWLVSKLMSVLKS